MNTIELNTADEIHAISDEGLGAVAGGFVTYNSGGAGGPPSPRGGRQGEQLGTLVGAGLVVDYIVFGIATAAAFAIF